jgi:hypothetical protein
MPSSSPDFLTLLARHNEEHGITATFSEMKKTARHIAKMHAEAATYIDPLALVLQYADPTGEQATDDYDSARERNRVAAAQRINRRTAAA